MDGGQQGVSSRARMHLDDVRSWLRREGPLLATCIALVAFGWALRGQHFAFPGSLTWDEHHFVLNARTYIHHAHDWNDHPPFGKLLIAIGMVLFGDHSFGWRIVSVCAGVASIFLSGLLAESAFEDSRAGLVAAAFTAVDGFLIAYSRTALLDGILTMFVLLTALLAVRARTPWHMAVVGAVIGAASGIKLSGVALGLPALVLCLRLRRPVWSALALGTAPVVYTATFSLGLRLAGEASSPVDAWKRTIALVIQQAGATQFIHPLTSHWFTWFLPKRPITIRYDVVQPGIVRASTTLGNLILWWSAALMLLACCVLLLGVVVRAVRARSLHVPVSATSRGLVTVFLFALTMLLPWIIGKRDSYIYHYLPTYALSLVMIAGVVARVYAGRRVPALGYVLAVGVLSAYYAPVWAQLPLTTAAFDQRVFLPMWR